MKWERANKDEKIKRLNRSAPDHLCPGCGLPIFSHLPICNKCWKDGFTLKTLSKLMSLPSSPRLNNRPQLPLGLKGNGQAMKNGKAINRFHR